MRKMTHPFFHGASILVPVGVFLVHRFETVGVFARFLCVKNAKTPSIWSSAFIASMLSNFIAQRGTSKENIFYGETSFFFSKIQKLFFHFASYMTQKLQAAYYHHF